MSIIRINLPFHMYKSIIAIAVSNIRKTKKLWLLGILASFLATAEETEFLRRVSFREGKKIFGEYWPQIFQTKIFTVKGISGFFTLIKTDPLFMVQTIFFMALALSAFLVLLWLSILAQGGMVMLARPGENLKNVSLLDITTAPREKFLNMAIINILSKVLTAVLFAFFILSLSLNQFIGLPLALATLVVMFCGFIIIKFSVCELLVNNKNLLTSLRNAFLKILRSWKECAKLAAALLFVNIFLLLAGISMVHIVYIPFLTIIEASFLLKFSFGAIIMFFLFTLVSFLFLLLIVGFLSALSWTSWSMLYSVTEKQNHNIQP